MPDRSAEVGLSPRPVPQDDAQDLIDSSVFDNGFNSDRTPSWRAFDEEDDDDDNDDEHNTPVLVQAVFSYEGQEDDELTFEKGKITNVSLNLHPVVLKKCFHLNSKVTAWWSTGHVLNAEKRIQFTNRSLML